METKTTPSADPYNRGAPVLTEEDVKFIKDVLEIPVSKPTDINFNNGKFLTNPSTRPDQWQRIIAHFREKFDIGKWVYDILYSEEESAKVYLKMNLEELFVSLSFPIHDRLSDLGCLKISSTLVNLVAVLGALQRSMHIVDNVSLTNAICNTEAHIDVKDPSKISQLKMAVLRPFKTGPEHKTTATSVGQTTEGSGNSAADIEASAAAVRVVAYKGAADVDKSLGVQQQDKEAPWWDVIDQSEWLGDGSDHVDALNIYRKVALTKIKWCLKLHRNFDSIKKEYLIWLFIMRLLRLQREIYSVLESYPKTTALETTERVLKAIAPALGAISANLKI
jgi:hypothetical protein